MTDRRHQQRSQHRASQPAQARARGNDCKQPLGLGHREQVDQNAPRQRDRQQIEDRQPDVERPRGPQIVHVAEEQDGEAQQVDDEEPIRPRQDLPPWHLGRDPPEQRQRHKRGNERGGEQPLQIFDAPGDPHGLAHGPQHEVAGEQQEEHADAGYDGRRLTAFDLEERRCAIQHGSGQQLDKRCALRFAQLRAFAGQQIVGLPVRLARRRDNDSDGGMAQCKFQERLCP